MNARPRAGRKPPGKSKTAKAPRAKTAAGKKTASPKRRKNATGAAARLTAFFGRIKRRRNAAPQKRVWRRRIAYWLALCAVGGSIALSITVLHLALGLPDTSTIPPQLRSPAIALLSQDGEMLARRGNISGTQITINDLPPHVIKAVISIEDRRFFAHSGLDARGMLRASWRNLLAGEWRQGGSTITQQLAKNLFLTPERSLTRKIREALLALWLEIRLPKEEILSLYLNRVYFGSGAYGIDAAARLYFHKPATDLSLPEAALLAGLLKAPSRYAPSHDAAAARQRAGLVLQAMTEEGYIDAETAQEELARFDGDTEISLLTGSLDVNYAADWLATQIPDYLGGAKKDVRVQTTLDSRLQSIAENVVSEFFARPQLQDTDIQIALVAMDGNGAVRAMVGGRSWRQSRFNRAAQARRQPGSAFKPVVYLAALERGLAPESRRLDAPVQVEGWRPRNYGDRYRGVISLREAFAHSSNSVAVSLSEDVGRQRVIATARRLGIEAPLRAHPSLPLGVFEISPLELTAAYVPFANGGYRVNAHGIVELRDGDDNIFYRRGQWRGERIISARALDGMNDLLRAVVESGTGTRARLDSIPAAGKTGTSQNSRDAWFIGFTSGLVASVWIGRDSGAPMENIQGGGLPAEIWRAFMQRAQAEAQ